MIAADVKAKGETLVSCDTKVSQRVAEHRGSGTLGVVSRDTTPKQVAPRARVGAETKPSGIDS